VLWYSLRFSSKSDVRSILSFAFNAFKLYVTCIYLLILVPVTNIYIRWYSCHVKSTTIVTSKAGTTFILPESLISFPVVSRILVAKFLVRCAEFCRLLFVFLYSWFGSCIVLSSFELRVPITPLLSSHWLWICRFNILFTMTVKQILMGLVLHIQWNSADRHYHQHISPILFKYCCKYCYSDSRKLWAVMKGGGLAL
jgi:hypothetical protein